MNPPPQDDEVEVSLFGPGYGESILVHLGQQDWLVVDSCLDRTSKQSAPLAYLQSIGVDPSVAIKLVVATHWHDDHVRGLGSVLRTSGSKYYLPVPNFLIEEDGKTEEEFVEEILSLNAELLELNKQAAELESVIAHNVKQLTGDTG